jgi:hypothetical protein
VTLTFAFGLDLDIMIEQGFLYDFLSLETNTQMTLTFDLDLDTDLAKRCISYVSIIILSIINND